MNNLQDGIKPMYIWKLHYVLYSTEKNKFKNITPKRNDIIVKIVKMANFAHFYPLLGAKWQKISSNHNMWYHFFHPQIMSNAMVLLILPHFNMKKSTFKGSPLWNSIWTHHVTSHKIGKWDFFKFGQNRKSSTYGVQKNKNRPWYIFLVLKRAQAQCEALIWRGGH